MSPSAVSFVCVFAILVGLVSSVPVQQQQQQQQQQSREDAAAVPTAGGGFATVLWSVFDDCFGGADDDDDSKAEPATVCLKSKALTALDRALSKPTVVLTDGLSLAARSAKSLADPHADRADRAALEAAKDSDHKNALLDDMLANRVDRLMATRTIVMDGSAGQEGRGKKKEKAFHQAMMMAGMMAAAVMGPMAFKVIALMAGKALVFSKIALVLSGIIALKKLLQPQHGGHETESVSHHYGRSLQQSDEAAAHDMAYSGQKQLNIVK